MLTRETIPCWYELAFMGVDRVARLVLRIHTDYITTTGRVLKNAPLIDSLKKEFGFSAFDGSFDRDLGFEGSLKRLGIRNDFIEFLVPTPLCRKVTDETCEWCNGSGINEDLDRACISCVGGKKTIYDYGDAYAVCASLAVVLSFMQLEEVETSAKVQQLLTVEASIIKSMFGAPIWGTFSKDLVRYLRTKTTNHIPEVVNAMKTVWGRLEGTVEDFYEHSFSADLHGDTGWLNINCPGDAAGIHPNDHPLYRDAGYAFSCHNLDHPMQQLTLLAALGALNYTARRDLGQR